MYQIYHKIINLAKKFILTNEYQNQSINHKNVGHNKRLIGQKKNLPVVVNNNGNLISEPTHVAKLLNAYFTEIAERLQCTGYLNIAMVIKNFQSQCFLHPQMMMK